jgi:hypothetical protein
MNWIYKFKEFSAAICYFILAVILLYTLFIYFQSPVEWGRDAAEFMNGYHQIIK